MGFFIAGVFLVVGCFLDAIPAIIIVGTILAPIASAASMHPVHFALSGIVSLAFGLVTPPYGLCLLISYAIAKVRLAGVMKDVMIVLIPMLLVLVFIILAPEVFLALPRWIAPDFIR
jgi:TRAP-type C4-dicarboxylate transport system permease large subunit